MLHDAKENVYLIGDGQPEHSIWNAETMLAALACAGVAILFVSTTEVSWLNAAKSILVCGVAWMVLHLFVVYDQIILRRCCSPWGPIDVLMVLILFILLLKQLTLPGITVTRRMLGVMEYWCLAALAVGIGGCAINDWRKLSKQSPALQKLRVASGLVAALACAADILTVPLMFWEHIRILSR